VSKAVLVSSVLIVHLLLSSSYAEDKPAASPASPKIGTVQRRVLIFDFENQTGKIEFDYLSGSISDALADSIKKTGKFRLMLREDARVNAIADDATAPAKATPAEVNSAQGTSGEPTTANTPPKVNVALNRNDAIKRGRDAGADVVVLGKFSELNGVLLMSAQAYEADTKLLKVAEEILTKSDSEMFNGINVLANKIAESMARELPMFDAAEAARRNAEANRNKAEERDWEIQLFAGAPLLHPLYSSDGTITYDKGIPVQKLTGYTLGAAGYFTGLSQKLFFMPKESRVGLQSKITLLSGQSDIVGANSLMLVQAAQLTGVFVSNHAILGIPYLQSGRWLAFAEAGPGLVYTRLATTDSTVFSSWQPSAIIGTSGAYHFSYWSLGLSYRAQFTMFSANQVFMQHDFWFYAGVRL
jgi:hypothetical protein